MSAQHRNLICIHAPDVHSALDLSERLFQIVQQAVAPQFPRRATAWFAHWTLINLQGLDSDPCYRQVQDGYWRELLFYTVRDFHPLSPARLCFADLSGLLNTIRFRQGQEEALEVVEVLSSLHRIYPGAFADQ